MTTRVAVIGLGYVGLPLALAFGRKFKDTVGFDIDAERVENLKRGIDTNNEELLDTLGSTNLKITSTVDDMKGCNFFVVGVPTPVDEHRNPDLGPLHSACKLVAQVMQKGAIVVFESTVYPGLTEEICGPWLAEFSGLRQGIDFKLGYSPERINPGDKEHSLTRIVKIVSGEDEQTSVKVAEVYGQIIEAGLHRASSIRVAEAAKVIENTQRDLNIALMNELAIIFDRLGISTKEVLDAAATKWNFMRFSPGLVGGHCIGVDPYYLTQKAEQLGYHPQVILAGRRINDNMGVWVAQRVVKLMVTAGLPVKGSRVGVLGVTFKENVSDLRNSRVPDIVQELRDFGVTVLVHDPLADSERTQEEYGFSLAPWESLTELDAVIFAVPHEAYLAKGTAELFRGVKPNGVVADLKSRIDKRDLRPGLLLWSL